MIEDISIKDFALINEASLEFKDGFTVLSGETGAGKSILIGAVSFLLGGKCGVDVIRSGMQEASVSGTIVLPSGKTAVRAWLDEHGIAAEDNRVLLRRVIRAAGKSSAWIQSVPVTRQDLAAFTEFLVDIHGQHEHQSLLRVAEHRRFLDEYAGIAEQAEAFSKMYSELVQKRRRLEESSASDEQRVRETEMLSYALQEIDGAQLQSAEDETLAAEEARMSQFEQLYEDTESMTQLLSDSDENVISAVKKMRSIFDHAAGLDASLRPLASRIDSVFYELSDIHEELRTYRHSLVFDPARLSEIQERLALLFKLKKKYAASVQSPLSEVLKYADDARAKLAALADSDADTAALQAEVSRLEQQVLSEAKALSEKRGKAGIMMAEAVERVLAVLGMPGARFAVSVEQKEKSQSMQNCGPYGIDNIEFLISTNAGEPLKPLAKIASGGELSRVMLALKTVLADSDAVCTLIFDEIDTGIGGEIAVAVGSHLKNLAKKKQILCITHLASIASCADTQMKIEKKSADGKTTTSVREINGEQRVTEIARMLAGDTIDEVSLEHARSLLRKYGG
ncbi:MAG: DNA repair protein RecN [Bacteroides sp.]|nr:DNA repair protein RecN [Prevotella sp.]MCM1407104.1 DNA repair protein RecN [Treponema brennaborense]MCM1470256.1 DNA repair protein RecN [Bacteroides sp.]